MGAVFVALKVANNFLGTCECFLGMTSNNIKAICCRPMSASLVSAPHSRTAVVTVNNRGGKAAICSKDKSD